MKNIEHVNRFMQCAINLSNKAIATTQENPPVGAVITKMINGIETIIGKGVTSANGRPHAEINAIENTLKSGYSLDDIKHSKLYVTLEPCAHYGKTPPCTKSIIEVGIKEVFIGLKDIDNRVAGQGITILNKANIITHLGILQYKAYNVLSSYFINKLYNRSSVTLKLAIGSQNAIGSQIIANYPISNNLSRQVAHYIRVQHQGILIGVNTALLDNPMLTTRIAGINNNLTPIILDSNLKIDLNSNLVQSAKINKLIIFCLDKVNKHKKTELEAKNVKIFTLTDMKNLKYILNILYKHKIYSVIVEGGAKIAQAFIENNLVDKYAIFKSETIVDTEPIYAPNINITDDYMLTEKLLLQDNVFKEWVRIQKCLLV